MAKEKDLVEKKGIIKACEKTDVSAEEIEKIVSKVENELKQKESNEVESKTIGTLVAKNLKKINKVAYIRFAAVFKRFVDIEDFENELKKLL